MTDFIRAEELLPAADIDAIIRDAPPTSSAFRTSLRMSRSPNDRQWRSGSRPSTPACWRPYDQHHIPDRRAQ
jgi:hypothetical protein